MKVINNNSRVAAPFELLWAVGQAGHSSQKHRSNFHRWKLTWNRHTTMNFSMISVEFLPE